MFSDGEEQHQGTEIFLKKCHSETEKRKKSKLLAIFSGTSVRQRKWNKDSRERQKMVIWKNEEKQVP